MPSYFCLAVRFLQPYSHGRGGDGEPEWPPSPLRVFQALVAAAAARWNERMRLEYAVPALQWLELQKAPTIVAAVGVRSDVKYRHYVPDNVADKVAKSWSGGREASIADYRTEKDVRPTHLRGGDAVHYLFPLADGSCLHFEVLAAAARSITHLGWGVDMVAGNAIVISAEEAAKLPGQRWQPAEGPSADRLRVPVEGTLNDLSNKHAAFLNRLSGDGFKPVPPLATFRVVGYHPATYPAGRQWAAFRIVSVDPDEPNPSFDTARRCRDVAAWVRSATDRVCDGWPFGDTAGFVLGHDAEGKPLKGDRADERFMYLPLPTIIHKLNRVQSIRRVLIAAPERFRDRVDWVRLRLPGQALVALDGGDKGMLNILPTSDWVLRQYTHPSHVWSTVTPVVWPGHDDRDPRKAEAILRKAFIHAGLPPELVGRIEKLEWRSVGFRAGLDMAPRYLCPEKIVGRQFHVRVRFPQAIRGPLAVGAGRYRGMGVFAADV
jgi:CRISPR-associated protein Csb2